MSTYAVSVVDDVLSFIAAALPAGRAAYETAYVSFSLSEPGEPFSLRPVVEFRRSPRTDRDTIDPGLTPAVTVEVASVRPFNSADFEGPDPSASDRRILYRMRVTIEVAGNHTLNRRRPAWDPTNSSYPLMELPERTDSTVILQRDALVSILLDAFWKDPAITVGGHPKAETSAIVRVENETDVEIERFAYAGAVLTLDVMQLRPYRSG